MQQASCFCQCLIAWSCLRLSYWWHTVIGSLLFGLIKILMLCCEGWAGSGWTVHDLGLRTIALFGSLQNCLSWLLWQDVVLVASWWIWMHQNVQIANHTKKAIKRRDKRNWRAKDCGRKKIKMVIYPGKRMGTGLHGWSFASYYLLMI